MALMSYGDHCHLLVSVQRSQSEDPKMEKSVFNIHSLFYVGICIFYICYILHLHVHS